MSAPAVKKIDVGRVAFGMFAVPWHERGGLFLVLSLPLMLVVLVSAVWHVVAPAQMDWRWWLLSLAYGLAFCYFAVRCHRAILLGAAAERTGGQRRWSMRETRFLLAGLGIYAIHFLAVMVLIMVVGSIVMTVTHDPGEDPARLIEAIQYGGMVVGTYFLGRLGLALPAAALDHGLGLRGAWTLSRGNGWRLALLVGLLPMTFSWLLAPLERDGAGAAEQVLLLLAGIPLMVVEIAALSLSYRELRSREASGG